MTTDTTNPTIEQILALRCEAGIVGDTAMHDTCALALYATTAAERAAATAVCARAIEAARAMEGT